MKFDFDWPSGVRGEDVRTLLTTTTTTTITMTATTTMDNRAWVYYNLTCERSAQVS